VKESAHLSAFKDSLKNEVLRRKPPKKNIKDPLPEPRENLGSGLKNRRSRIFQWILKFQYVLKVVEDKEKLLLI
jgi:hypothetical protein